MVGIYADKGITGTSVKKRDDFNRLMRHCKQGKVDMIITKSVARFARNTLDCLKHTRMLKEHNVDVYFEEQGIHSIQPGAEFYITIYGSIAQSESENISANVRWGKAQSAKEGNVPFHYKRFLGYRRGPDGKPEIDPEQAVVVKRICERFLAGDSLATIANNLNADGIPTPSGIGQWQRGTIESMLSRVLRLCAGTWEGDENSFSANILNGITRLVYTFGNQLNDEVFKERVGALSIKQLVRMSKERCPGSMGYAEAMLLEYNGKKKNISQRLSMNKLHMQGTAGLCSLLSDVDTSSEAATAEGVSE